MRLVQRSSGLRWSMGAVLLVLAFTVASCGGPESDQAGERGEGGATVVAAAHAHATAGETCFICDATKREKGRLWCREHGRYEDRCWLCHPELEDVDRPYCTEHFLYEDECFLCHPELQETSSGAAPPMEGGTALESPPALFCNEHNVAESECGICQPDLAASLDPGKSLLVRMPSAKSAEKAGIRVGQPIRSERTPGLEALCEVDYNRNTMARITPLADGIVNRVLVDVGDEVKAGDILVELHSADVARAKSTYLSALVNFDIQRHTLDRERELAEESISARKDLLQAEAGFRVAHLEVKGARQMLANYGMTPDEIARVERS